MNKAAFQHGGKTITFNEKNGQWHRGVWNGRTAKSESFYFGRVANDPTGKQAMYHETDGWIVREAAIKAGIDKLRIGRQETDEVTLSALAKDFLEAKRSEMLAGDISLPMYKDYLREIGWCVSRLGAGAVVNALRPQEFSLLARLLVSGDAKRGQQGSHARKRIIALIKAMFHWGEENGRHNPVRFGTEFVGPDTSPQAIRKSKIKAGKQDHSNRIVTGVETDKLLGRATPLFKAIVLLSLNCGLGPADIGRLRWHHIDLDARWLDMARGKTGEDRRGYLWKRTVKALRRVMKLKHNHKAIEREGQNALVFLTRKNLPMYRETEIIQNGKSLGVKISQSISGTFGRMAKDAGLIGVTLYRFRHTYKTLGKKAKDRDALHYMMGHAKRGNKDAGEVYDHEEIEPRRVRRVARVIYRRLWPKPRLDKSNRPVMRLVGDVAQAG